MLLLEETLILLRVQRYKFSIYKKGVCTYEFMSIDFSFGRLKFLS